MEIFVVEGIKLQRQQELRLPGEVLLVFLQKNKKGRRGDESFADSRSPFALGYLSLCGK